MEKEVRYVALLLVLAISFLRCSEPPGAFSPGPADARLVGTWQLHERQFLKDSLYSVRIDTLVQTRDTLFYTLRRYSGRTPQTLRLNADGTLSAEGTEMTYYTPIRYFRLDSTFYGLGLNLFITTNGATQSFRQTIEFRGDTLLVLPQCRDGVCDRNYYLKFLRAR